MLTQATRPSDTTARAISSATLPPGDVTNTWIRRSPTLAITVTAAHSWDSEREREKEKREKMEKCEVKKKQKKIF